MTVSTCTFTVSGMTPTDHVPEITTGLPVGHVHMEKTFSGALSGRSVTQFTGAFDPERGVGHYVAFESFDGTLDGRRGTFAFVHAAATTGTDRVDEYGRIVAGSGTGELAGLTGAVTLGGPDGHTVTLDYELPA